MTRHRINTVEPEYGDWTVIEEIAPKVYACGTVNRRLRVRCKCGFEAERSLYSLHNGKSKSCEKCGKRVVPFSIGERVGILTVLDPEAPGVKSRKNSYTVQVRCDCGQERHVYPADLRSGRVVSCGCKRHWKGKESPTWRGHGDLSGLHWQRINQGAKVRGIKVEVSIEQVWELFQCQGGKCALTGVPLAFGVNKGEETTASLDRIDSSQSYTLGNLQWVHKDINVMKRDLPQDSFIEWCRKVANHSIEEET